MIGARIGSDIPSITAWEKHGWVEIKNSRGIYIRTDSGEVVILSPSIITPYTISPIKLWHEIHRRVKEGDTATFHGYGLTVRDGLHIVFQEAGGPSYLPRGSTPPIEMIEKARGLLHIIIVEPLESVVDEGVKILNRSKPIDTRKIASDLRNVIGVGPGMTPAGDDFVSGVLLALHVLGVEVDHSPLVEHAVEFSSWPSWKMLEHSSHGCTFRYLTTLFHAMLERNSQALLDGILQMTGLGSSSGISLLTGFLETLKVSYQGYPLDLARSP